MPETFTREDLARAFRVWEAKTSEAGYAERAYSEEEWAALTPEARAEERAKYLVFCSNEVE
jgi:hypothetical protein